MGEKSKVTNRILLLHTKLSVGMMRLSDSTSACWGLSSFMAIKCVLHKILTVHLTGQRTFERGDLHKTVLPVTRRVSETWRLSSRWLTSEHTYFRVGKSIPGSVAYPRGCIPDSFPPLLLFPNFGRNPSISGPLCGTFQWTMSWLSMRRTRLHHGLYWAILTG